MSSNPSGQRPNAPWNPKPPAEQGLDGDLYKEDSGGYDMFRNRALHPRSEDDEYWRTGFDHEFRKGQELAISEAIFNWMDGQSLHQPSPKFFLDIGSGASTLTDALTTQASMRSMTHVVVDSEEMLSHLAPRQGRVAIPGQFPRSLPKIVKVADQFAGVLAYSVLQYVTRDMDPSSFVRPLASLVQPGGCLMIGDIPNRDMRDRQYQVLNKELPRQGGPSEIRDELVFDILRLLRREGLNAFVVPQVPEEPMRLHRENIVAIRPSSGPIYPYKS